MFGSSLMPLKNGTQVVLEEKIIHINLSRLWMFSIKQVEAENLFTGFVTSALILTNA
jgi:hypothetical protein